MRSVTMKMKPLGRLTVGLFLVVTALGAIGCSDPGYAFYAVTGQLDLVSRMRPVGDVLADGSLTDEQQAKMRLMQDIRNYAANDLKLRVGDSYTSYLDTGGDPIAYNLSASAKDSLNPVTWSFPFAGTVPYLGFFHLPEAQAYRDGLVNQGYDTVLYGVEAYSTLGTFPDPITTTMLERSEAFLADLIFHESTHNTVWRVNDTTFNENVASFVARAGAIIYLTEKYGASSDVVTAAENGYHDGDLYNGYLTDLYWELRDFYASGLSSAEKIAGRATIFADAERRFTDEVQPKMIKPEAYDWVKSLELNNAWILANARYNSDLSAFQAVYNATGQDFAAALQIFAGASQSDNPIDYLWNATK